MSLPFHTSHASFVESVLEPDLPIRMAPQRTTKKISEESHALGCSHEPVVGEKTPPTTGC